MSESQDLLTGAQGNTENGGEQQQAAGNGEGQGAQQQPADGEGQKQEGADKGADGQGEQKAEGDKPKAEGAPDKYEAFKVPEGMSLDGEVVGKFEAFAKELGLPQDKAQAAVDMAAELVQRTVKAHTDAWQNTQKEWVEAAKKDAEYGGERLTESLSLANKAIDALGGAALVKVLGDSGLANNPELIRAFYRAGKLIAEDKFVMGGASRSTEADLARKMFPTMN